MKDYYEILNVGRDASAHEIKRAYRLLAIRYHPDKNSDPAAEQLFKEINEAYEVLGDAYERQRYDGGLPREQPAYQEPVVHSSRHRDPAYKRRPPHQKVKSEKQRMFEMMQVYVPLMTKVVTFALVVSGFFFFDFILPNKTTTERIIQAASTKSRSGRGSLPQWRIMTHTGKVVEILYSHAPDFRRGTIVEVERSRFLGIVLYISNGKTSIRINKSLYGNFSFAPLALFGTAVFGWYYRWRIDYVFNAGVVSILLLMLTFVLYLVVH
jgi:hypothetical protein